MRRLKMSPRRFAVSRSRSAARGRRGRGPTGSTITWLMNEKASVTLAVQRISRGRHVAVMTLKRTGIRGENTVRFSGRVGRRTLRPGRYRVRITARTPDGRHVGPRTLTFTVVRG
jgi:multidrug resistance efflux pump